MSYNGSGTFVINSAGQPVVANTVISATVFNALTADLATGLSTAITKDGQTTVTANIPFGNNKITTLGAGTAASDAANLGQVQSTAAKLITVTGTDTISGTMSPALTAYAAGQLFYFVANAANTGAVTINIDGLGAKNITRDGATALAAGDINSGEFVVVIYDGTRFQMINAANSFGNTTINGTLTVTGNTALQANVSIASTLSVGGTFAVTGAATLGSTLAVTGKADLPTVSTASINAAVALVTTGTVTNLTATGASIASANIGNLQFTAASIASINAGVAVITNLTATGASIASANVGTAVITAATVTGASIASMNAGVALLTTATVTALTATGASIASANVGTAVVTGLTVTGASIASVNAGTATLSGDLTLNGGTANGVGYLNASKVLTTGSALTFNGTNLVTTGTTSATKFIPTATSPNVTAGNGMYLPDANEIAFSTNGNERLRIKENGAFGVGTPFPNVGMQVANGNFFLSNGEGFSSSNGLIRSIIALSGITNQYNAASINFRTFTGDDRGAITFSTANNGTPGERVWITNTGDVGIGTGTPSAKLDVIGTAQISSSLTLSGGTANGVLYLNGSKVATSGSAITFDGTDFATTGTATATKLVPTGNVTAGNGMYLPAANTLAFSTNGSERVRVTSAGNVGIGTSSPIIGGWTNTTPRLTVSADTNTPITLAGFVTSGLGPVLQLVKGRGTQASPTATSNGDDLGVISVAGYNTSDTLAEPAAIRFQQDGAGGATYVPTRIVFATTTASAGVTERMRLDSSGNLGLGVVPSAWSGATGLQVLNASLYAAGNIIGSAGNSYLADAGANDKYIANGTAVKYLGNVSGDHRWFTAPSGTAGDTITFTQGMTLNASAFLGVGATSQPSRITIEGTNGNVASQIQLVGTGVLSGYIGPSADGLNFGTDSGGLLFRTGVTGNGSVTTGTERARITAGGDLLVGTTTAFSVTSSAATGVIVANSGAIVAYVSQDASGYFGRQGNDGTIIEFRQDGATEGSISVSGNTVSYNAFAGSHWSQLQDGSKPDILRGTVMESINELCEWPGEENERLPKAKISDTAGSKKVYGVFMAWDNDWSETNDMYVTAVGAFICRVNSEVTVQQGDLLESNGDGTARVQADDIIRSSTIGKVTSTVKTHEYDDGSYCVPTVLYCG